MENIINKLVEYENIGMGFEKLVSEYSSILKEIEKNKWALSELHKSLAESKETTSALDDAFDEL